MPLVALAWNSRVQTATKMSPIMALSGRRALLPQDLIFTPPGGKGRGAGTHLEETLAVFRKVQELLHENNLATTEIREKLHRYRVRNYNPDELVWLIYRNDNMKRNKLSLNYGGPFVVKERGGSNTVVIQAVKEGGKFFIVHQSRLHPYVLEQQEPTFEHRGPLDPRLVVGEDVLILPVDRVVPGDLEAARQTEISMMKSGGQVITKPTPADDSGSGG